MNAKYPPEVKEGQKIEELPGVFICCGVTYFAGKDGSGRDFLWRWCQDSWYEATYRSVTLEDVDRRLAKIEQLLSCSHPHSDLQNTPESPGASQDSDR